MEGSAHAATWGRAQPNHDVLQDFSGDISAVTEPPWSAKVACRRTGATKNATLTATRLSTPLPAVPNEGSGWKSAIVLVAP